MIKIINIIKTIISMPVFIIAYMFFCITKIIYLVIIIGKVILKMYRKNINLINNYLNNNDSIR